MGIRENIIRLRNQHGLTQEELAKIAGVSRGAVSQWEGGFSEPRMGAVQKMADYFNVTKGSLIEDHVQGDELLAQIEHAYNSMSAPGQKLLAEIAESLVDYFRREQEHKVP